MLFNPSTSFFVLAVDSHNIPDATERAVSLIKKVFQKYYEEYKLPYKLVLFDHLDFCENLEQFYEVFNYFSEKVAQNSYRVFGEEDYQTYKEMHYIKSQLKDIAEHGSLDDERVLVYCQPVRNVHGYLRYRRIPDAFASATDRTGNPGSFYSSGRKIRLHPPPQHDHSE